MINLVRTDSNDPAFIRLVNQLDDDLARRDGNDHAFYAPFNRIDTIRHAVLACAGDHPVGCGAIKEFSPTIMEIKRMYTAPASRGTGIATGVLLELERWAAELGYKICVLETGKRQPEAIELYKKNGYHVIPNYGQYVGIENSVCFEKKLAGQG